MSDNTFQEIVKHPKNPQSIVTMGAIALVIIMVIVSFFIKQNNNIHFFLLTCVIILAVSITRTFFIIKYTYGELREEYALKVFFSTLSYPNFFTRFGKFPTRYLNPLYKTKDTPDGKIMSLSLRDFYIASAFRPYQVAGQTYDICSYKSIRKVIEKGARFHFIDVWSSNPTNPYDNAAYPIVRNKTLMPGGYGSALQFDKVCELYKNHAWVGTKYPLILYLNLSFTAENNRFVLNKIAEILWNNFRGRFTGVDYSFAKKNIGDIPIKEAMNNVIILTNVYPKEGNLQELINGVISENIQNAGRLTVYDEGNVSHGGIKAKTSNMQSVIDFNKTHIGIVIPGDVKDITNVYQPGVDLIQIPIHLDKTKKLCDSKDENAPYGFKDDSPFNYGYNMVCINYQKPGKERDDYIEFFKESSLVLKCDNLRYIPGPKPVIKQQNIKASYGPRDINYQDGYFAHGF